MHLWTHADRPLIGMRLFLAHQAASLTIGWRAIKTALVRAARELEEQRRRRAPAAASPNDSSRAARTRARLQSEVRDDAVAASALEDEVDPAALPAARLPSVGILLRETREALGGDLQRISTALRIRPDHLRAIEAGDYAGLPARAYAMGFIRSYADYLGLDAAEMVRRFKQESPLRAPELALPQPLRARRISLGGALVGLGILALCGVGAWYELSTDRQDRDPLPAVPAPALVAPPPNPAAAPARAATSPTGPTEALSSISPAAGPTSLAGVRSEPAAAHGSEVTQALRSPPAATAPATTNAGDRHAHIVLRATAKSWFEVKDGNTVIFRKLLEPGDEYPLPDKPGLSLHFGNVHGIDVLADGKPLPIAAQPNQGRRAVVTLDAGELLAKAATP
jgi:cytoskeleton protein RodZ